MHVVHRHAFKRVNVHTRSINIKNTSVIQVSVHVVKCVPKCSSWITIALSRQVKGQVKAILAIRVS